MLDEIASIFDSDSFDGGTSSTPDSSLSNSAGNSQSHTASQRGEPILQGSSRANRKWILYCAGVAPFLVVIPIVIFLINRGSDISVGTESSDEKPLPARERLVENREKYIYSCC